MKTIKWTTSILALILLLWVPQAFAQYTVPDFRIEDSELEGLDPSLVEQIRAIQPPPWSSEQKSVSIDKISSILERDNIPDGIRRKLRLQEAKLEPDEIRRFAIYESLLDPNDPLKDLDIRSRIMWFKNFESNQELSFEGVLLLLDEITELVQPLLSMPKRELSGKALSVCAYYANVLREIGSKSASRIRASVDIESDHLVRQVAAAQVRIYFCEEAVQFDEEVLAEVEQRIEAKGPGELGPPRPETGYPDHPLINLRRGILHQLDQFTLLLEKDRAFLRDKGVSPSRDQALMALDKFGQ